MHHTRFRLGNVLLLLLLALFGLALPAQAQGFLYVLRDVNGGQNQLYGFAVNETTGALTALADFPLGTGGNGTANSTSEMLAIDKTNGRLYAINEGSNTISAYAINPVTGALTPLPFSPINLGAGIWATVSVHPSGSPLVVSDAAPLLRSYQITATNATEAPGSPYSTGTVEGFSSVFSQDGNYVYTGGQTGTTFAGFSVNAATGQLTALAGSPFASGNSYPLAYVTDNAGRLLLASFDAGEVRAFTTTTGIPSAATGNPFTSGLTQAIHGVLHPNGFYLVADPIGNRVGVYQVSGSGSATTLTAVAGSPFAAGGTLTEALALTRNGGFLFAANGDTRNLRTFSVNGATGALTTLGTQAANTLGGTGRLTGIGFFPSNGAPVLNVQAADPAVCLDPSGLVGVTATVTNPANNPAVPASFMATLPTGLTAVAGTCAADVNPGGCAIGAGGGSVTWNGTLNPGQTVTIIYRARLAANVGQGAQLTIQNQATVGGIPLNFNAVLTVNCPNLTNTRVSDQKPGSLLVFPYYTSTIGGASDTRMTISKISNAASTTANQAYVHLFFIDGTTCAQADLFLCLTPNASFSFKASDFDPGNTGYLLAVAVDRNGVPVQNNVLIGNAFVRTPTLSDNYGAESFWANSFSVALVSGNTATLFFDQAGYDAVPKQFAVEVQSPLDAVGQQVVTAGLSGDLTTSTITGAAQVGTAQAFNEKEQFASFQNWLTGTCQARGTVTTSSPRVPNGLGNLIKTGQSGHLKFNVGAAVGVLLTPRGGAWTGLRTLHKTQTTTTSLVIPIFVPVC